MKKIIYFLLIAFLFACQDDEPDKGSTTQQMCNAIKVELMEDGQIREDYNTFDQQNRLSQKCIAWDGVEKGCLYVVNDTLSETVTYLFNDTLSNQTDTLFKAYYKNDQIIEYNYDFDSNSPDKYFFKYDENSEKLIEFRSESGSNEQVYSVETDAEGDPTKLTLTSRTTNSVYDEMEIKIFYDDELNPLRNDLSTPSIMFFFPKKNFNYYISKNAESNYIKLNNQSTYNGNGYPARSVLKDGDGDTLQIRKFTYNCY